MMARPEVLYSVANRGPVLTRSTFNNYVLQPTTLYHGTNCAGDFSLPDGPAWFCLDFDTATKWSGWSTTPPRGKTIGRRRVLACHLTQSIELLDTRSIEDWQRLGEALAGDTDPYMWTIARLVSEAGYNGWLGNTEVMLSRPSAHLEPMGSRNV